MPSESVERTCGPLRKSHHRTRFTMDRLVAMARRPSSARGKTRYRGTRRRRPSRHHEHQKGIVGHQGIPRGAPSQSPQGQLTVLFRLWNREPRRKPKFQAKKARASGPDQIPPRVARSFVGCSAVGQTFAVLYFTGNFCHSTSLDFRCQPYM